MHDSERNLVMRVLEANQNFITDAWKRYQAMSHGHRTTAEHFYSYLRGEIALSLTKFNKEVINETS